MQPQKHSNGYPTLGPVPSAPERRDAVQQSEPRFRFKMGPCRLPPTAVRLPQPELHEVCPGLAPSPPTVQHARRCDTLSGAATQPASADYSRRAIAEERAALSMPVPRPLRLGIQRYQQSQPAGEHVRGEQASVGEQSSSATSQPSQPSRSSNSRGASHVQTDLAAPGGIPEDTLPPGWTIRESRRQPGLVYYYHPATGRTTLHRPEELNTSPYSQDARVATAPHRSVPADPIMPHWSAAPPVAMEARASAPPSWPTPRRSVSGTQASQARNSPPAPFVDTLSVQQRQAAPAIQVARTRVRNNPPPHERDQLMAQFMSLQEDLDPETAMYLLESVGWDVSAALSEIYTQDEAQFREALRRSIVDTDFYTGDYSVPPAEKSEIRIASQTTVFRGQADVKDGEERCAVCLNDFEIGDGLRVLACGHSFHMACVDKWLSLSAQCPVCKKPVSATQ